MVLRFEMRIRKAKEYLLQLILDKKIRQVAHAVCPIWKGNKVLDLKVDSLDIEPHFREPTNKLSSS